MLISFVIQHPSNNAMNLTLNDIISNLNSQSNIEFAYETIDYNVNGKYLERTYKIYNSTHIEFIRTINDKLITNLKLYELKSFLTHEYYTKLYNIHYHENLTAELNELNATYEKCINLINLIKP